MAQRHGASIYQTNHFSIQLFETEMRTENGNYKWK